MKVEDLMTREVRTVGLDASLKDVAALLAEHRIGGVPVVDEALRPLGVITKADIVLKELADPPPVKRGLFGRKTDDGAEAKVAARTAGEAMTAPAVTISPAMPVASAAAWMVESGINRLPVVQRDAVVGIITRHDLVRVFARSDAEIEREIRDDALAGTAWPDSIQIMVSDGEVTLRGQADSIGEAEMLPLQVRHVLGVVAVDAELQAWDASREEPVKITTRV
jgi:CBS domain-containing protein